MAYDEDYAELIDNAESAIRALLAESREEAFIDLRAGLREIGQAIRDEEARDKAREIQEDLRKRREEAEERLNASRATLDEIQQKRDARIVTADRIAEWRNRREQWKRAPWAWRESVLFDALGSDRMTIGELTERIDWKLTPPGEDGSTVYGSDVRNLVKHMLTSGQLEREGEPFRGKVRYRYFRSRDLDGPIAELERAFHDEAEAA